MKTKLQLFLLLIFITGKSFSQEYIPLLNNATWIVDASGFEGVETFTISQDGEVIIGAYTYKKFIDTFFNTEFLLREDIESKKVYKIVGGNEVLLFDFSLHVSDFIILPNGENYQVASITNINVNGGQRRQFSLNNLSGSLWLNEVWVEGVGSKHYPLFAAYELYTDPEFYLKCSFQNGQNVYNQGLANGGIATNCIGMGVEKENYLSNKIKFTPNPFQIEMLISREVSLQNAILKMYNATGQIVKEVNNLNGNKIILKRNHLNSGIYLIQLFENERLLTSSKVLITD